MKTSTFFICSMALAWGCFVSDARAQKAMPVGAKSLSLQAPVQCAAARRPGRELARYLIQYNPAQDPKSDISDETPRTAQENRLIREGLVEHGFRYPNGEQSVITWLDVDGDGACDFTASAGIGGARATDRMFLFQGRPEGGFRLADAYHAYMDGSSMVMPYIALTVSGEKLPVLVSRETLMQWQNKRKQFATCDSVAFGPQAAAQRRAAPVLTALCPHRRQIYTWFAEQLPRKNEVPHSPIIE